jgi:hypothetical protein
MPQPFMPLEVASMSDQKTNSERRGTLTGGVIVLGVGVLFLLINMDILPSMHDSWPVIPIIVGVALIVSSFYRGKDSDKSGQSEG